MNSCAGLSEDRGFPIRKFTDQSLFAAPRNLSQRTTSFIASQCQGIHQMLLSRLIALITDAHPGVFALGKKANGMIIDGKTNKMCIVLPVAWAVKPLQPRLAAPQTKPFIHNVKQHSSKIRTKLMSGRKPANSGETDRTARKLVEPDGIEPTTSSLQS